MAVRLEEHPVVLRYKQRKAQALSGPLDSEWLRKLCMDAGADDVGFVEVERPEIQSDRADIFQLLPGAKTLISLVAKLNRGPIRSPARSVSNTEFHSVGDSLNHVAHKIVTQLEKEGIGAVNPAVGFPMEMDRWTFGKIWTVSHKKVAVAAGLGQMGIHRNVIHPMFGSFILLDTIIIDREVSAYTSPVDYNPCVECKLCVAACPTGAIGSDGYFDFSACYTHNYREFMGGFVNWVENIADSKNAAEYRKRVTDSETTSMWQTLSFEANYKSAYCISVCPAGEDVIGPFLDHRSDFLTEVVKPLQQKSEIVYVVPKSDAEEYVPHRFPNKTIKQVSNGLRVSTIAQFLRGLRLVFQRNNAKGIATRFHFTFTGKEPGLATISIHDQVLEIQEEHVGKPDLRITADSESWLGFLRKERNLVWELIRRKIRLRGDPRLLLQFRKCFPS